MLAEVVGEHAASYSTASLYIAYRISTSAHIVFCCSFPLREVSLRARFYAAPCESRLTAITGRRGKITAASGLQAIAFRTLTERRRYFAQWRNKCPAVSTIPRFVAPLHQFGGISTSVRPTTMATRAPSERGVGAAQRSSRSTLHLSHASESVRKDGAHALLIIIFFDNVSRACFLLFQ